MIVPKEYRFDCKLPIDSMDDFNVLHFLCVECLKATCIAFNKSKKSAQIYQHDKRICAFNLEPGAKKNTTSIVFYDLNSSTSLMDNIKEAILIINESA